MTSIASAAVRAMLLVAPAVGAAAPAIAETDYAGTLGLAVDATDLDHGVFRVHEEIPVSGGALTLLYPQWLPGNHAPRGPIDKLAGLVVTVDGKPLTWTRDSSDVYAFHLDVPQGAAKLVADFEFLAPQDASQGRVVMTPEMLNLQWNTVVLYPAGHAASRIRVEPSVKIPPGWQVGSALDAVAGNAPDGTVTFKQVSLETLVDSPLYAGRHFKRVDLDPGAKAPVHLDLVADDAKDLEIKPEQLKLHQALVSQAYKLFGSHHYDHYDLLLALTDHLGDIGLEHQRSSENTADPGYFTEWDRKAPARYKLPHELTHSWNGKFRRPADLATANYNMPMGDSLLWVYEGQTQYWGYVLDARSGLWTAEQTRDALALVAARYERNRPGFSWRTLQDTTNDPVTAQRRPLPYRNYQMSEEYYNAGMMIWLAVDAKLRELSRDRHSLDDFARAFFGVDDGSWTVKPYVFDDIVTALNAIVPNDWASFLRSRIEANAPPLDGLPASGWKLVYTDKPSEYEKSVETEAKFADHSSSVGLIIGTKDAKIIDVRWDGPAFKAGIAPSGSLIAVQGHEFTPERLKDAIAATATGVSLELLIKNADVYRTFRIDYRDGLKYPHLERIDRAPDRLSAILTAKR